MRCFKQSAWPLGWAFALVAIGVTPAAIAQTKDILPILEKNCYECHGRTRARGRLRLHASDFILKGGASGPIIEAGHSDRSLMIVAVLTALYRTDQLRGHIGRALDNGVTREEIGELITHLAFYAGWPNSVNAGRVAKQVFDERG